MNEKKKAGSVLERIGGVIRVLAIAGAVVLALWLFGSCADSAEEKARNESDEREERIVEETERRVMDHVYDVMPPLEDILSDAYNPDDLENDIKDGVISLEEAAAYYRSLYEAVEDAYTSSELYK